MPWDKSSSEKKAGKSKKKKGSKGDDASGCTAPSKQYGDAAIDDFLQASFDICETLQEAQALLSEINDFLADPGLYIAKKGAEAKANLISQLSTTISDIPEKVIKRTVNTMKGSGDITGAAKNLGGMDKIKAIKDVAGAVNNFKSISETAPQVLEELSSLVSKLSE